MDMVDDVLSVMDKYIERKESSYLDRNSLGTFKLSVFFISAKIKKIWWGGDGTLLYTRPYNYKHFVAYWNEYWTLKKKDLILGNTTDYSDTESRSSSYLTESWKQTRRKF